MVRKSNSKRKTFQSGAPKRGITIRAINANGSHPDQLVTALGIGLETWRKWGEKCLDWVFKTCISMAFLPLANTSTPTNSYCLASSRLKCFIFNSLAFVYSIVWIYRLHIVIDLLANQEPSVETFMCMGYFFISFCPWVVSLGVVLQPGKAVDLINSWSQIVQSVAQQHGNMTLFTDVGTCLEVISMTLVLPGAMLAASLIPLFFDTLLPATWMGTAEGFGLISTTGGPMYQRMIWHLIFLLLEGLLTFWPVAIAVFTSNLLLLGTGVLKGAAGEISCVEVRDMEAHGQVEDLYVCLEIYAGILGDWARLTLPFAILGAVATVVGTMIVVVKYGGPELPLVVYLLYPTVGGIIGFNMFSLFNEAVHVTRISEGIRTELLAQGLTLVQGAPDGKVTRAAVVKRVRALRPVTLPVGRFTHISIWLNV